MIEIGTIIQKLREERNISRKTLVKGICSESMLAKLEIGERIMGGDNHVKRIYHTLCFIILCFALMGCSEQKELADSEKDVNTSINDEADASDEDIEDLEDEEQEQEIEGEIIEEVEWAPTMVLSAAEGYRLINGSIYNEKEEKYYKIHDGVLEEIAVVCDEHQISFAYEGQNYNIEFETMQIGTRNVLLDDTIRKGFGVEVADISEDFQQVILRLRYDTLLYYDGTKCIELIQNSGINNENLYGCFAGFAEDKVVIMVSREYETEQNGIVTQELFSNILLYNPSDESFTPVIEEMSERDQLTCHGRYVRFKKDNALIIKDLFSGREVTADVDFAPPVIMSSITDDWLLVEQRGETELDVSLLNVMTGRVLPVEVVVPIDASTKIVYCDREVYFSVFSEETQEYKLYQIEPSKTELKTTINLKTGFQIQVDPIEGYEIKYETQYPEGTPFSLKKDGEENYIGFQRFDLEPRYKKYNELKRAENFADWRIGMTDGQLLHYIAGDVGISIYQLEVRIPAGDYESGELSGYREEYAIIWGHIKSNTIYYMIMSADSEEEIFEIIEAVHIEFEEQ